MFKKINKKGFTLAELLIVVAIIGVLVAISIPIFTAQLEKAREATDIANLRAAKAAAVAAYLDGSGDKYTLVIGDSCYYNSGTGVLDNTGDACGKGTTATTGDSDIVLFDNGGTNDYKTGTDAAKKKIKVKVTVPSDGGDATVDAHFV